jgi:septal ring-binding cell division protein DamX
MEEKSKLLVIDKKEAALLFVSTFIVCVIAFLLGIKVGKRISYERAGFNQQDFQTIDLKSKEEELAQKIMNQKAIPEKEVKEDINRRLEKEIEKLNEVDKETLLKEREQRQREQDQSDASSKSPEIKKQTDSPTVSEQIRPEEQSTSEPDESQVIFKRGDQSEKYVGKFTIQLGSHPKLEDAKEFANGFSVRGYNPIINEVYLKGRGTWYRVSLGHFETIANAKSYIEKEKSLFQNQEYVISEIK